MPANGRRRQPGTMPLRRPRAQQASKYNIFRRQRQLPRLSAPRMRHSFPARLSPVLRSRHEFPALRCWSGGRDHPAILVHEQSCFDGAARAAARRAPVGCLGCLAAPEKNRYPSRFCVPGGFSDLDAGTALGTLLRIAEHVVPHAGDFDPTPSGSQRPAGLGPLEWLCHGPVEIGNEALDPLLQVLLRREAPSP